MNHESESSVRGQTTGSENDAWVVDETSRSSARAFVRPSDGVIDRIVSRNGAEMLRVARRHSVSAADAEDAFQRSLEKLITRAPSNDEARLRAWLLTVVRNEALTIVRGYKRSARESYEDVVVGRSVDAPDPSETVVERERLSHGREALRRLTTDQMRCLLLRADGFDYDEICQKTGFSYPKVNRCLTEGRKAFRGRVKLIDSGGECRRLEPVLSMIADGVADGAARADVELHLGDCALCRQTLREFRLVPSELAAFAPIGLALPHGGFILGRLGDAVQSLAAMFQERVVPHVAVQQGAEAAFAKKAVAVSAIAAVLAGGGVAADQLGVLPGDDKRSSPQSEILPAPMSAAPTEISSKPAQDQTSGADHGADKKPREVRRSDLVGGTRSRADLPRRSATPVQDGQSAGDPDQVITLPPESVDTNSTELGSDGDVGGGEIP